MTVLYWDASALVKRYAAESIPTINPETDLVDRLMVVIGARTA